MSIEPRQIPMKKALTQHKLRWNATKSLIITFHELGLDFKKDLRGFHVTEFLSRYESKCAK